MTESKTQHDWTDWLDFERRPDYLDLNDPMLKVLAEELADLPDKTATSVYDQLGNGIKALPEAPRASRYVSQTGEMVADIDDGEDDEIYDPLGDTLAARGIIDDGELDDKNCWPMFGFAELQVIARQVAITHRVGRSRSVGGDSATAFAITVSGSASSLLQEAYYHFVAHSCPKSNMIMRSFIDSFMNDLVEIADDE